MHLHIRRMVGLTFSIALASSSSSTSAASDTLGRIAAAAASSISIDGLNLMAQGTIRTVYLFPGT